MERPEVEKIADDKIKKAMLFPTRKYGDTPSDDKQLTPKGYVTSVVAAALASISGVPGGNSNDVQFNDGGNFGGDDSFQFLPLASKIVIGAAGSSQFNITSKSQNLIIEDVPSNPSTAGNITLVTTGGSIAGGNVTVDFGLSATGVRGNMIIGTVPVNTGGYVYLPNHSGPILSAPDDTTIGATYFDSFNNALYVWNGSAWKSVILT